MSESLPGSGRAGRGKQPEREAPEATDSPDGTTCPTILTPNANGMITMTAADLLVFCQQMMLVRQNNNNNNNTDDLKHEMREYQREVKASLNTKTVTTFDGSNYQA
ncbi:hypothetical protein EMCG_02849 [[Emmonsia] crescens]|uniref:Uncharacterized protein n=1 Tax=[Emmonsia] crescens TaxID=73230 RepID=A0A0G2J8T8_9EURO|nr:hypothetical protein EMCG_02849 [Emmonsia crescens UAMH 3008]